MGRQHGGGPAPSTISPPTCGTTLGIPRPRLDSREAANLVGYLFTLNYFDTPGNAEAGRKVFTDKGCAACHTFQGSGGNVGSRLDHLYSARYFGNGGNIQNGWAVATNKGCLTCHAVRGERGKPASDVTKWRELDSPAAVLAAF